MDMIAKRQAGVEKIFEDVKSITCDVLGFESSSHPYVESNDAFVCNAPKYVNTETWGYISEHDLKIHLNTLDTDVETFKSWSATLIAFFQPYAFFLENTKVGSKIRIGMKDHYGSVSPDIKFLYGDAERLFLGIGKWAELETEKRLRGKYNYELVRRRTENNYEASYSFQLCERLWHISESSTNCVNRKIVSNAVKYVGNGEDALASAFDNFVNNLEHEPVIHASVNHDRKIDIESHFATLNRLFVKDANLEFYRRPWTGLIEWLKRHGHCELSDASLGLYRTIGERLQNNQRLSELNENEKERIMQEFRDMLNEVESVTEETKH